MAMIPRLLFRLWPLLLGLAFASPAAAQRDPLAEALALPQASALAGARDVPRFAWIQYEAGVRNIWIAAPGQPARRLTSYSEDDGQELSGLAFSNDGAGLAFVRGGDEEFPDQERRPNTGNLPFTPPPSRSICSPRTAARRWRSARAMPRPSRPTAGASPSPAAARSGSGPAAARRGASPWSRAASSG
jgi:hypothetical protein